jgi:hypothetical protein
MALQPFVGPWPHFPIFDPIHCQPVARPPPEHRTAQTQNKRVQTSMPLVGFDPRSQISSDQRQFMP